MSSATHQRVGKLRAELIAAGYKYDNRADCRGCQKQIDWWTTPSGKKAPYDLTETDLDPMVSHFATCELAVRFRQKGWFKPHGSS